MNKERAAKSINSDRFVALLEAVVAKNPGNTATPAPLDHVPTPDADAVCPASPTLPMTPSDKLAKAKHGLETAIDLYGQDRHCELDEFWAGYIDLLVSMGCVDESKDTEQQQQQGSTNTATTESSSGNNEEEEALLAQQGEVSEDASPVPVPASASASTSSNPTVSSAVKKRVITEQDIADRAKMNAGRPRYLSPDDDAEEAERTITNPITYLKKSVLYKESVQKASEVNAILADVEINDGNTNKGNEKDAGKWTPTSRIDAKGYGTYYRAIEGTPYHSLKVVGEVDSNVLSTLAVLCELDLYKEWFPMCWHSEEQGRVGDLHRWSVFTITCPWPVASRRVFVSGFGVDCVYKNKIVIVAKSADPEKDYMPIECAIPGPQSRTVTATLNCGGFVLEPLKGGRTKVAFTMNIDPKLRVVPISMINWFSGKLIWVLLKQLGSAAAKSDKVGSAYHKRREEQKELYEYFRQRALQVLPPDHL